MNQDALEEFYLNCVDKNESMPAKPSVMGLHLKYRLLIAQLNSDTIVLRILGDYLTELRGKRKDAETRAKIDYFEKEFQALRNEVDEIRHEMQLIKMKLGAYSRESTPFDYKAYHKENHGPVTKRLKEYKAHFNKIKKELGEYEGQWLS
jgi:uncharacterized coiled-coil DUF342 family protein